MKIISSSIPEIKIIIPEVHKDNRGYFFESWQADKYAEHGITCSWVQDNESKSTAGVIRGLHYQSPPYTQAKLVRVIEGKILDIAVDIRKGSPTFKQYVAVELSAENKHQLFIPRGFAHGFAVLSVSAILVYKCDNIYMPGHERGIAFNDPELNIDWRINPADRILSSKDLQNPLLAKAELFDFAGGDHL